MLTKLVINNMIIIDSLNISIHQGLTGFTGETGAGKTLLFDALELALGGTSNVDLIRTGKDEANVEVVFSLENDTKTLISRRIKSFEQNQKISFNIPLSKILQIRRTIERTGISKGYLNNIQVPKELLACIGPCLLDFSRQLGQSELLNPENYLNILDHYAKLEKKTVTLARQLKIVRGIRKDYQEIRNLSKNSESIERKLKEENEYFADIEPQKNEYEKLKKRKKKLEASLAALNVVLELYVRIMGEEAPHHLREQVKHVNITSCSRDSIIRSASLMRRLDEFGVCIRARKYAKNLNKMAEQVEGMADDLKDFYYENAKAKEELEQIESRIEILENGIKKYGSWQKFYSRMSDIDKERKRLQIAKKRFETLPRQLQDAEDRLLRLTKELEELRIVAAEKLGQEIRTQLLELAMDNAKFQINVERLRKSNDTYDCCFDWTKEYEDYSINNTGANHVSFYFSANVGEPLRPLHETASGGELSRILLALKYILANQLKIHTFIFDEIDTGVSGKAATLLAKKLREMADQNFQILMITHTAPVAAIADQHYFVTKKVTEDNRTQTKIMLLDMRQRVEELARITCGDSKSKVAVELGKELLEMPKTIHVKDIPDNITELKIWKKHVSNHLLSR